MNDGEQDSENSISSSKLSAAVPAFVPGIAYNGVTSPKNPVINSNLSPLVPEFKPSVCFTSLDLPPHNPVHVHNFQYHVKQENIESQQDAPLQAYRSIYSPSKKITVRTEGNDERLNAAENTTAENVTDSSSNTNTKRKRGRRKKKERDSTQQQGHEEFNTAGLTEGQQQLLLKVVNDDSVGTKHEQSTISKANEQLFSRLQKNSPTLHSSLNSFSENTEDRKTNVNFGVTDFESFSSTDEQWNKKQYTTPTNFTVSYSDKVKSLVASKNSSTASRHLDVETSWVKDFTPDSSSMKDKHTQRSELHAGKSTVAKNLRLGEKREAKGGRRGDGLKKRPDSTWNARKESEYDKLRNGEPLKSQARHVEQIPRAGKQMGRNNTLKKMTCDDDENWRVNRVNANVVDSTRTDTLKKPNIMNLNNESLKKRTYTQEVDVDSKKFNDKGVKHEKYVGHIAANEICKSSKKQLQTLSELGSGSSEKECTRLHTHSLNVRDELQKGSQRTIEATNAMSVAPSNSSTILEGEFPDLCESVKIKRPSSVDKRTIDHKEMISSPKPSAPMSYSAVLRSIPQPKPVIVSHAWENEHPTKHGGLLKVPPQATAGGVENEAGTKQKKKKKKKKKKTKEAGDKTQENSSPKRTEKPIQFDLGVMLQTISNRSPERKQSSKRHVIATGGVLPSQLSPDVPADEKPSVKNIQLHRKDESKVPHNTLDSTAPVLKRGKERENPARKKPSALKKIILKEREEKKKARETGECGETGETDKDDEICQDEEHRTCEPEVENIVHQVDQEVPSLSEDDTAYPEPSSPTDREIAAEIHSRKFREYCFQVPNKDVDTVATELLKELVRFQDRQFHKDPVKAKAKRRFVLGLREVSKHLKLRKLKCVIISSNVERIKSAGGLDDTLDGIINSCQEHQIPVVFALKRQLLGKVLFKKVPVSIVGIFNYDGAQEQFKTLIELTEKTRQAYSEKWQEIREKLELQQKEITDTLVPSTEMDNADEAGKIPYITGEDADSKNHNAEVTESSDDDDDDDDDDDHYDVEEEEENSNVNDRHNEKEDVIIVENDLEIQDF